VQADNLVSIDEMVLRIPGLSREAAVEVAQQVAQTLAQGLPAEVRLDRLGVVVVRLPLDSSRAGLVERITQAIVESVR
jgi:hypothetical protein